VGGAIDSIEQKFYFAIKPGHFRGMDDHPEEEQQREKNVDGRDVLRRAQCCW
jgi:hypothetical protein